MNNPRYPIQDDGHVTDEGSQNPVNLDSASVCSDNPSHNQRRDPVTISLQRLPKMRVSSGFDSRMAALFAMEVERELLLKNQSLLQKRRTIRLPDLIPDLREEFQ